MPTELYNHSYWLCERRRRQRSEQYFTSSQQSSHFLRQVKGRSHTGQIFVGKSAFERARPMMVRSEKIIVKGQAIECRISAEHHTICTVF
ncbi:hypothetical protein [Stenomitos frigidus]|uniref:Transposase n=1 Tax=Stenomitos frigidus AS-A4 TaxID=2933935 RepID=A0ABV0KI46_9CYAN